MCRNVLEVIIYLKTAVQTVWPWRLDQWKQHLSFVGVFRTTFFTVQTLRLYVQSPHTHTHTLTSSLQASCCGGNSADGDIIIPRPLSNMREKGGNLVPATSNITTHRGTNMEGKTAGCNKPKHTQKAQTKISAFQQSCTKIKRNQGLNHDWRLNYMF